MLIIEDVQDWNWIETLQNEVPDHLKEFVKVYDLREKKGRYDDIVFTIDKLNTSKQLIRIKNLNGLLNNQLNEAN